MKKRVLLILVVAAVASCRAKQEESPSHPPRSSSEPDSPPIDPATAATVSGRVLLEGTAPAQEVISMAADATCVRMHEGGLKTELVVTNPDGSLRNVFVYVKEGLENYRFRATSEPAVLEQRGCVFVPHVVGVMTGQPLDILNSDDTLHNIHAMPEKNPPFNLGQPRRGSRATKTFEIPEVMIPIRCDVHKWMKSYLGVVAHPYFEVTGDGGRFELSPLPPGRYVIEAWHETYGTLTQEVNVGKSESKQITFTFHADSESES